MNDTERQAMFKAARLVAGLSPYENSGYYAAQIEHLARGEATSIPEEIFRYCASCGEREGSEYAKHCCADDNMIED